MIRLEGLSKRYGDTTAVDSLDLTVSPGRVTGFLGPHGAGKSTTMRMILGLDTPTEGAALVDGRPYAAWPAPLTKVGALLGDLAHEHGVRLHELHTQRASLEEAYMELTADSVQYGVAAGS
ncbi:ABC transporter family protein [Kribbella sp. VKM Ac-2527]|uniref:ABC transporter family protein n=1 Tax=Kribbella caucasensis TaxID=2512215 RepID=A0A4R6KEX3_9ACTN|nr:ABC transporter family protein [Kribbella sp. VKM Ac-2527]